MTVHHRPDYDARRDAFTFPCGLDGRELAPTAVFSDEVTCPGCIAGREDEARRQAASSARNLAWLDAELARNANSGPAYRFRITAAGEFIDTYSEAAP